MGKPFTSPRSFWLTILAFTIIVNLTMTRLIYLHLVEIKADLFRSTWGGMLVVFLGIAVGCAWLMDRIARNRSQVVEWIEKTSLATLPWRILGAVIFIGIAYLIPYIKFTYRIGETVKQPVYDPVLLLLFYYWMCWWEPGFHEHCVERVFADVWERCRPEELTVHARFTRRGGIDISPYRSSADVAAPETRAPRGSDAREPGVRPVESDPGSRLRRRRHRVHAHPRPVERPHLRGDAAAPRRGRHRSGRGSGDFPQARDRDQPSRHHGADRARIRCPDLRPARRGRPGRGGARRAARARQRRALPAARPRDRALPHDGRHAPRLRVGGQRAARRPDPRARRR